MAGYGDGSDGALSISSGSTSLSLNHKYQYTSINIASGATLTTSDTTGAVLYLLCQGTCTIAGTIDLHNKVTAGDNTWSVILDSTTYSSPGVAPGGAGQNTTGQPGYVSYGGTQSAGFGGGGAGGETTYSYDSTSHYPGNGGNGGATAGAGGSAVSASATYSQSYNLGGNNGGASAGGSGPVFILGDVSGTTTATSGAGGSAYGANGGAASGSGSGATTAGGGGGAGGSAGKAGVHLVIKAASINFTGTINTSGTNGGDGGTGGSGYTNTGGAIAQAGGNGGGGGGGSAGDIYLISDGTTVNGTTVLSGGTGGSNHTAAKSGSDGVSGTLYLTSPIIVDNGKLLFSSSWDIDQLVDTNTVTISGSGDTEVVDFSSLSVPANPVFECQFKPSGSSQYFTAGANSTDGTTGNVFSFYSYTSGSKLYIHTSGAGTARYFIWSDKVDY